MYKYLKVLMLLFMGSSILSSCGEKNREGEQRGSTTSVIEGTYYWQASNIPVSHTIVIKGGRWSSTNVLYDEVTHDFGYVKGKSLYDSSGLLELARVSGNSIHYGGHTLKRD